MWLLFQTIFEEVAEAFVANGGNVAISIPLPENWYRIPVSATFVSATRMVCLEELALALY